MAKKVLSQKQARRKAASEEAIRRKVARYLDLMDDRLDWADKASRSDRSDRWELSLANVFRAAFYLGQATEAAQGMHLRGASALRWKLTRELRDLNSDFDHYWPDDFLDAYEGKQRHGIMKRKGS
jgi:hypothetical protein